MEFTPFADTTVGKGKPNHKSTASPYAESA
jgi:hypothetical protein